MPRPRMVRQPVESLLSLQVFAQAHHLSVTEHAALRHYIEDRGLDPWGFYPEPAWEAYYTSLLATPVTA